MRLPFFSAIALAGIICAVASAAPATRPAAVKPTQITEQCVNDACHAGIVARKVQHGPVAQRKCEACHLYDEPREHRFKLASSPTQLCRDCHTLKQRTVEHTPVKQGACTGCHDPHGSDYQAILVADPTRGLCLSCHKQNFAAKKFVHGPVSAGACIVCHEPHSAWQPNLLTETPEKLCVGCHSELVPKGDQARHIHAPVKDANCTGCHDAHASDFKAQLREAAPALCLSCHKETGKMIADSRVMHGAVQQGEACNACHAPHFSELPKLQKAAQPQSCLTCHDRPLKRADGTAVANIAQVLKENPHQHGPIREGACTACHQPHASRNFSLLAAEYPPEFYAPFTIDRYALCFKCHIPDLVLKEQGTGLTRFRNADVNLHWLHVNREKGRSCRSCHEVHASRNPFHIRDTVPFGNKGWMLEIGYKQTPAGGRCSPGCHTHREYDRGDGKQATTTATTRPYEPLPEKTRLAQ